MKNKLQYLIVGLLVLAGCTTIVAGHKNKPYVQLEDRASFAKTAVMITEPTKRSGGTGVIVNSSPLETQILTNKHVCQLVQNGGKVITDNGKEYNVDSFRVYKKHDLCLVSIMKNLNINIKIAQKSPKVYSSSIVVGHPALLPTIVTVGHFSQWRYISLIIDMKACDGSETDDEALACVFTGGKPVIKEFAAQTTSSLIMPGSSGSAVYNEQGELSGLVFAGNPGLSYGFIVPWEYVNDFMTHLNSYPVQTPDPSKKPSNFFTAYFKFQKICDDKISYVYQMDKMCRSYANLGLWHE